MSNLLEQAKAAAAKLADQTEDKGGNFEYEPPAAGPCVARLVSYIEIGTQKQPAYQGKEKKPAPECILEFQLLGKKHAKEIESEEDGKKITKTIYPIIRIGRGPSGKGGLAMPGGSKSNHYKLLKAMDYGRGNTHMAFMLGEAFIVTVVHNDNGKEGKDKVVYANLKDDSGWKIGAPVNPTDGEPIAAPEATVEPRMLLWDAPSLEQWNSIHIPGSYTKKEGDKEVEVSKNWIQPFCQSAVNFEGSGLQAILAELSGDLPDVDTTVPDEEKPAEKPKEPAGTEDTPEPEKAVPAPSEKASAPTTGADADPLADLGL